jgi:DNA-directed RNA polymerase subunit RPC12/RpoP
MASYIHQCTSCGTALTVHERYFGRILRCTNCGAHFEAIPPAEAEQATSVDVVVMPEQESKSRPWRMVGVVLTAAVAAAALLWCLSTDPFPQPLVAGTLATIAGPGGTPVALDSKSAELLAHADSGDGSGIEGPAFATLNEGTRVQVLESADRYKVVAVRVLDGSWASRKVWVPARRLVATPAPAAKP